MSFANLGLSAELLRTVAAKGYSRPTPVQTQAIPVVLAGHDVLAGAQTGTGKTAAFALPILEILTRTATAPDASAPDANRVDERPAAQAPATRGRGRNGGNARAPSASRLKIRTLVLTPTRELAAQIGVDFSDYGAETKLRSTVIFGGVGMQPQVDTLRRGVDIVVATPGRLLDHANQGNIDLSHVEILVLDEADRMLDMGFIHDIRRIQKLLPTKRQNLLFSATYSSEIRELASKILHNPKFIEAEKRNSVTNLVQHRLFNVPQEQKRALLIHLANESQWYQVLVFSRTKHGANRLSDQLNRAGLESAAIHGNKSQNARTRALADFKNGKLRILVATDIAARGLDISKLPCVVNFDLPNVPEDYVHRIGRTGRAGEAGIAVSLVSQADAKFLRQIERVLGQKIEIQELPEFTRDANVARESDDDSRNARRPAPRQAPQSREPRNDARRRRPRGPKQGTQRASGNVS
jgi:ATP-dependent RNA helicase RhlE